MANFEAFHSVISSSIILLFLKSETTNNVKIGKKAADIGFSIPLMA